MKVIRRTGNILYNLLLLCFSISCIFPIIWVMYSSLKTKEEFMLDIISLPKHPQFQNYYDAFVKGKLYTNFASSAVNTVITVCFVLILAFCVAYVLSRYQFKGRNAIYSLFLVGMMTPVYALLVPLFVQMKTLHMEDKWFTLIIPYIAIRLPLAIFLFESFIRTIPWELEEAAYMDGATVWESMTKVVFPLCRPVMSTVLILTFLDTWNEFPFALVLVTKDYLRTLPVGLTNFNGQFTTNYTTLMAALVISILPVMLVYFLFSKKIIQGMTAGAVKG